MRVELLAWCPSLMRRDRHYWGPDREGLCPCGSRRRIRSCHGRRDGSWRAEPWSPPVRGASTGYAHHRCYAKALNDCSEKLSREHYISRAVLNEIGPASLLSGLPLLSGEEKRLPNSALTSKILCGRHNSQLSALDNEAAATFRALRRFEMDNKDSVATPTDDFEFVDGPRLEAWMLKSLFGLLAAGQITSGEVPVVDVREGARHPLLEVLFQGNSWPDEWGLYVFSSGGTFAASADLALRSFTFEGRAWALEVEFGPFLFQLSLGRPDSPLARHRPGAVVVLKDQVDVQKILGIGWPDGLGGSPVVTTRVGQMEGWDTSRG